MKTSTSSLQSTHPNCSPDLPAENGARPSILLVEDLLYIVTFVQPTLQDRYDITVAANVEEVRAALAETTFQLVLLDLNLGDGLSGLDLIPEIVATGARVIVASAHCTPEAGLACLRNGVYGFIDKHKMADDLITRIEKVLAGHQDYPFDWLASMQSIPIPPIPELDPVEFKVLSLLVLYPDLGNKQIGAIINKAEDTIKKCMSSLYHKFNLKGRFTLILEVKHRGFLPDLTAKERASADQMKNE